MTNAQPSSQSSQSTRTGVPETKQSTTLPLLSTIQALNQPTPVTTALTTSNQQYPVLLNFSNSVENSGD